MRDFSAYKYTLCYDVIELEVTEPSLRFSSAVKRAKQSKFNPNVSCSEEVNRMLTIDFFVEKRSAGMISKEREREKDRRKPINVEETRSVYRISWDHRYF